jgi:UDP-N-acetylmuramoyl-tripeptide--D-alanyl-D-alanine ligase
MQKLLDLFYLTTGACTDTRKISKNCLYIALKGENFNGNTFAEEAIEKGAMYAIVDEKEYANNNTIFWVEDALTYLQNLANHHRQKYSIPVIGITGSNGKTTTKELVANVLSQKYTILCTTGNLNNHIGVPLTLLQLNNSHDLAIIEMGANKPFDIKELAEIAEPTHGIITNIGAAHLEGFGSKEGVLKTKKELYDFIEDIGGTIFYNLDDDILSEIVPIATEHITYGTGPATNISGAIVDIQPEIVFEYVTTWDDDLHRITSQIIGKYNFYNMLAAVCIGDYFELSPEEIKKGIESYTPENNRSQVKKTENNTLILDAYNANPTSVESALESFAAMKNEDKFFILGDMLELGEETTPAHLAIIAQTKSLDLKGVFVGDTYASIAESGADIRAFRSKEEAKEFLSIAQPKGNLILLKGSRGIGLETLIDIF